VHSATTTQSDSGAGDPVPVHEKSMTTFELIAAFVAAYNCQASRPQRVTRYAYDCEIWTKEPERLILDPLQQSRH
jgi:hypothetical protein